MKTAVGLVIWAIIVLLTLFVSIKITIDLWNINTVEVGPHKIASVSSQSTVTIPESNITITGQNYFEIQDLVSKEITLPEVIPPAIGETNTHFNIKNSFCRIAINNLFLKHLFDIKSINALFSFSPFVLIIVFWEFYNIN